MSSRAMTGPGAGNRSSSLPMERLSEEMPERKEKKDSLQVKDGGNRVKN